MSSYFLLAAVATAVLSYPTGIILSNIKYHISYPTGIKHHHISYQMSYFIFLINHHTSYLSHAPHAPVCKYELYQPSPKPLYPTFLSNFLINPTDIHHYQRNRIPFHCHFLFLRLITTLHIIKIFLICQYCQVPQIATVTQTTAEGRGMKLFSPSKILVMAPGM